MKVLIVDDSRAMRMILMRSLRQAGFADLSLAEAANGMEALEAIATAPPDVVLSDWNMDGMSGLELLKEVRARHATIKFGLITTEASAEMQQQAIKAGATFYLTKPFTVQALQAALAAVMA